MGRRPTSPKAPIIWLMGGLAGLGAASLDMYLPSLPMMAADLDTGRIGLQATITTCMVGLAAGQLLLGSSSDRWGRRPVLLIALGIYVVGCLGCLLAPTLPVLLVARVLQGVGAGAAAAIARAVARDLFDGHRLVTALGVIVSLMAVAPVSAPLAGAVVHEAFGWRAVFAVLAGMGIVLQLAVFTAVTETRPSVRGHSVRTARLLRLATVRDPSFLAGAGPAVCTSAAMFAYLGVSSFVLQESHGLTPGEYSMDFGLNAVGLMLGAWFGRTASSRLKLVTCVRTGVGISLLGGTCLALGLLLSPGWLPPVLIGFLLITAGQGWTCPPGLALAMAQHADRAGSVSSWFGALQYGGGAIVVLLTGPAADALAVLTAIVIVATVGGIALSYVPISPSTLARRAVPQTGRAG
jgi:MFS transporter, DHA1 family, multidrug resistance protein